MKNHQHAYNQQPMQRLFLQQQPHLDFASHTDHQSYFNQQQPRNGQTQALNTPFLMDNQPQRTEGSTHTVHAQFPVSSASFSNNASEGGLLDGTPDLTEDIWTCIIPDCSEVFVLYGDFSRHYNTAHPHLHKSDAHRPTITNAASLPSDGGNHTHIPTVSTSMSQSMSPPKSNENCVDCQKKKRCTFHTTKKIGPRMKPGDACEVCKKQKKKCQGATCRRAQRLAQAVRMDPNTPNATSGSQEWEGSQSASPGPTHVSSPTFTVMDAQVLADVSMAEHASSDPSSVLPSFNTLSAGSNIALDLDPYLGHASLNATPYQPLPITAAGPSFRESLFPDRPDPSPDQLPTSILYIPNYLTNTPFSILVENQTRLAQRDLQTNEGLKQKLMLPSAWNSDDCCNRLVLSTDGMAVEYKGLWKNAYANHAIVRSNYPIPPQCGLFYWEIKFKFKCPCSSIRVGVRSRISELERIFYDGWFYDTHDGTVRSEDKRNRRFGPKFFMGDTIGCGINFKAKSIFFTKNGEFLGTAFKSFSMQCPLCPFLGLDNPGDQVETNFGAREFKFDVLKYMKGEKLQVWQARDLQYNCEDSTAKACECSKFDTIPSAPVSLATNAPLLGDIAQVISNPVSHLHRLKPQERTYVIVSNLRNTLYEKWAATDDALVDASASTKFWKNFNRTFYGSYDQRVVHDHEWLHQALEEQYAMFSMNARTLDVLLLLFELVKGIQAYWEGLGDIEVRNKLNEFLSALETFFEMDDECPDASRRAEALKTFYAMKYDSNGKVLHGIITWRILLWFNIVCSFCAKCKKRYYISKDEVLTLLTKHVLN